MCVCVLVFGEVHLYIIYVMPSVTLRTNILHSEGENEKKKRKKSLCDTFAHSLLQYDPMYKILGARLRPSVNTIESQ